MSDKGRKWEDFFALHVVDEALGLDIRCWRTNQKE